MKEAYPRFLALLRERGYVESTIGKYRWVINRLLAEAESQEIHSFEEYYATLKESLSSRSMPEIRTYLGAFKHYVETGTFYRDTVNRTGFMRQSSYARLNPYYKALVDNSMTEYTRSGRYATSTIQGIWSAGSAFCLYFQQIGHDDFSSVCRQHIVLGYFHDGRAPLRSSAHRYQVSLFLSANADNDTSCATVLSYLPLVPDFKKNFDYLKPEECVSVESALAADCLTLRDRAIGIIAYYTGLRSSEIASLMLDDIDLERGRISIASQ